MYLYFKYLLKTAFIFIFINIFIFMYHPVMGECRYAGGVVVQLRYA